VQVQDGEDGDPDPWGSVASLPVLHVAVHCRVSVTRQRNSCFDLTDRRRLLNNPRSHSNALSTETINKGIRVQSADPSPTCSTLSFFHSSRLYRHCPVDNCKNPTACVIYLLCNTMVSMDNPAKRHVFRIGHHASTCLTQRLGPARVLLISL
jgi:hypothetical protein